MKIIIDLVDNMDDEIELAKIYSQNFLIYNADKEMDIADRYRRMAYESIDHADTLHDMALDAINKIGKNYKPPEEMIKIWNKKHGYYVATINWIKDMLK